ncbi:pyridoxamine 5'-phosphate oxidase family protein [Corynebacterium variabile]|uniref:pyridoxamine 5'-phosphate oxidase family protein n=1 Tax=Corynebacterium variabile TaxID=1727 RepID=UPI001DBA030C|nr:pyridoxamine 5'-phosphate oxidase family protein [Corynebacterium variabile]HJG46646.1 pyridoxamine 5'-phosphate oxidase family protein [Corynebacterium variabile]
MAYADIAFDGFVKTRQEARGVGNRVDTSGASGSELDPRDAKLIRQARMFMMSTVTGTGWPYVQHKGGPAGFVKVRTVGGRSQLMFPDFAGNRQFVTAGNLDRDDRVCLFFVDFTTRSRVKVFGHARLVEADAEPDLIEELRDLTDSRITSVIERAVVVDVVASDANCSKQITPRWTRVEVEERIDLYRKDIAERDARIAELEAQLAVADGQSSAN